VPAPVESHRRYVPGLDGIRALAVVAVLAYHLGIPSAQGGMLGVGVFFTLSGYLITDLLLAQWREKMRLDMARFWLFRARRLLPALLVMLPIVTVWVAVFDAGQLGAVRRELFGALLYVSNWSTIAQHGSYFARFAAPLPLDHLWSLAIEEQFYLIWPWLLLAGLWFGRTRRNLLLLTLAGAVASAAVMALLYHPGYDPTRVYEGTDTRAFQLLIGAALAIRGADWFTAGLRAATTRNVLDIAGVAGLVGIALLIWRTNPFSLFLYPYGLLLLSLATAAVIVAVVHPASRLATALGCGPLRWVGVRSYGIYLWQWPLIVLINPGHGPLGLWKATVAVAGAIAIAALSWRCIEDPIRHGALERFWRYLRARRGRPHAARRRLVLSGTVVGVMFIPALGIGGLLPVASDGTASGDGPLLTQTHALKADAGASLVSARAYGQRARRLQSAGRATSVQASPDPKRTSCRAVVYIGDSTSEGETSSDYIPNVHRQLVAQLHDIGVGVVHPEISGARSIVETYKGLPNAAAVARGYIAGGYRGCWILALGTNDVADVQVGSNVGLPERIDRMMSIIGDQPVLWVDAATLVAAGSYAEQHMEQWNQHLLAACHRYPNMRIFDWSAYAKRQFFIPDGVHYYSPGYLSRSFRIAHGLAHAFPDGRPPSPSCVVT
jgi:peptidoglycan/LPS O-acetylase OafA/YrhL